MRLPLILSATVISVLAGCGGQEVRDDLLGEDPAALTDFLFMPERLEASSPTPLGTNTWMIARAEARVPIFDYDTTSAEVIASLDEWGLEYFRGPDSIIVLKGPSRHNFGANLEDEHVAYGFRNDRLNVGPLDQAELASVILEWGPSKEDYGLLIKLSQFEPLTSNTRNNVAWAFATHHDESKRRPAIALQVAKTANELSGYEDPEELDTLAAAYAAVGDFEAAVETQTKAIEMADPADAGMRERLDLFAAEQIYVEPEEVQSSDYVPPPSSELVSAAMNGDADAQYEFAAWLIENGVGQLNDLENPGAHYLLLAAEQGHVDAIAETGYGLLHGYSSFPRDPARAAPWLDKGIALNNPLAVYNKAIMYRDGIGVARDEALATEMLLLAAGSGIGEAALEAGFRLLEGVGSPVDEVQADALFAAADATLSTLLFAEYDANFYYVTNDAAIEALPPMAISFRDYPDYLMRVVEKIEIDSLMAREILTVRLPSVHIGFLRADTSDAVFHLLRGAARMGSRKAQLRLARMYGEGIGVEVSAEERQYWLERAARNQRQP